jgi:hypothetical protein
MQIIFNAKRVKLMLSGCGGISHMSNSFGARTRKPAPCGSLINFTKFQRPAAFLLATMRDKMYSGKVKNDSQSVTAVWDIALA